jgi:hypothetical protein
MENRNHTASQESVEECPAEESLTDQPPELSDVPTASESGDCKICHQNTAQKCAFCHNIWICGDRCRREAMVNHIFECSPGRPLDSADYLAKYCLEMQLPDDIDTSTCDDFGFSKVYTRGEKSQLLLLYIYLMDSTLLKWDSRILHKWQRENRLAEMLKKICVPILQLDRMRVCVPTLKLDLLKECCSWFLQNQHVVDANSPPLEHSAVLFEGFRRAWRQIGLEDASDDAILSAVAVDFPKVKGTAFQFYTIILLGISPSPSVDLYIDFGFCACPDDDSEAYLVWVYRVLIASCSFEEFCTAFKSRQVFRLLQKYIFNAKIQRKPAPLFKGEHSPFLFYKSNIFDSDYQKRTIPHLQAVLEKSSTDCDAVWRLKQFILSDECLPRNTVITKYGFFNCRDALERLELKRVYNQLLMGKGAVDPMDLQSACANNSLYEFASAVISLDPKFKRLMRNSKYVLIRVKDTKEVGEALNCLANASRDTQSITKEVEEALISLANASRDAQSVHTKEAEDALSSLANASRDAQSVPQGSLEEGMRRRHKFAMPDAN